MGHGVFYLLTGIAHAARMAVSLWNLRKHYTGPAIVYTTIPASHEIGDKFLADKRLYIEHRRCENVPTRKNSAFLTKVKMLPEIPFKVTTYLDADTMPVSNISEMGNDEHPFTATHFADWMTHHGLVKKRIDRWKNLPPRGACDQKTYDYLIQDALKPHPAINGGVFSYRKDSAILKVWYDFAMIGVKTFICDEVALQILLHHYPHRILDCRYNCSPIYAKTDDPRIYHFHGEKHLKKERCREIWWPAYEEVLKENVGEIQSWTPANDKELIKYLEAVKQ